ncbi:MAG: two-component sensor histidine kinase [Flavipsychrobacter sp.]|nr:two-component sensor histidine kinase [Flavipsychrobacter sp.]
MEFYFFKKINEPHIEEFRTVALHHNARTAKVMAAIIGMVALVLYILDLRTDSAKVLHYPAEYSQAITFILYASGICFLAFLGVRYMPAGKKAGISKLLGYVYAFIIVIASLWITFVMQHNPSNTMSIFVLGILTVAALWIFEASYAIIITLTIILLFDGGLRYFQTDPCKLFANYITGTLVAVFFLCISRITFSINYNHFKQVKKLAANSEDMNKVNAMQTEILTVVAHDLHAPINNIVTLIDILKRPSTTDEEREEFYDLILTTCQRSDVIIDDLLSVARADEKVPGFATTLLNDFVRDAIHSLTASKDTDINIIYHAPKELLFASINPPKMMRVLDNLISNAIKFTTDNGIINIDLFSEGDTVYLSVRDNGIGIPQEMLPQLFTRFSKASRKGLHGQKSYGLGLSICKLIMTQHHGNITATSSEGRGTTMTLTLPRFEPDAKDVWDNYLLN